MTGAKWRIVIGVLAILALGAAGFWMTRSPERTGPVSDRKPEPEPESAVPLETRQKIDRWIEAQKLNRFGDPPGTRYSGGTPLFDARSGKYKDRYAYILERHPELK